VCGGIRIPGPRGGRREKNCVDDTLYVADSSAQNKVGAVLSVCIQSKKQAVLASGGLLGTPEGIALEANGQLLVTSFGGGPNAIVRVDAGTGQQSYVTMLPGQAARIAVESTGQILVASAARPARRSSASIPRPVTSPSFPQAD